MRNHGSLQHHFAGILLASMLLLLGGCGSPFTEPEAPEPEPLPGASDLEGMGVALFAAG